MLAAMIISDPKIMMGKPVVRGTRITVELILEKLAAGESEDQFLTSHPRLTVEGIRAAIALAAEALRADRHSVQSVAELEPGIDDEAVLRESRETNAILLTADKDLVNSFFGRDWSTRV